jgi:hypothetical protein
VGALNNFTERNFFNRACIGKRYVEGMISAGDRSMFVDGAEIGVVIEKNATILNRTQTHDGLLIVELDPKRIIGGHGNFVMCVKANELEGRLAGSIDDPLDIGVGDANDSVAAAVAATGAPKFQILLPVLRSHFRLRLAINYEKQKSVENFLATFTNIFYIVGVMDGSPSPKQSASKMMLGFIVRRCAADLGHTPTPDEFAAWANGESQNGKGYCLFGKPISPTIAQLMFRQPGRLVTVRPGGLTRNGARGSS